MTAEVISFPTPEPRFGARPLRFPGAQVAAGDSTARTRRVYRFADVCGLLSLVGQQRTMIGFLRDLATQCGMPLPRNPRRWGGSLLEGPAAIDSRSVWCAMEFDAWLDSRRSPPPAHLAEDVPPLPRAARDELRERARYL